MRITDPIKLEDVFDPDTSETYYNYVFDASKDPGNHHPYMFWNDRVYVITVTGYMIDTGITRRDF